LPGSVMAVNRKPIRSHNLDCMTRPPRILSRIKRVENGLLSAEIPAIEPAAKARFSEVCEVVDKEISAPTAAVGDGAGAQLSCAMDMGEARWDRRHAAW
jgi:hypothetical protein